MNPKVSSSCDMTLAFRFPLPRPLTGVALGNGVQGLLIWGEDALNVTVARNGFWDHRGMRKHDGIMAALGLEPMPKNEEADASLAKKPYQIGGGRLVLRFEEGLVPQRAIWKLDAGAIRVELSNAAGRSETVVIWQSPDAEIAFLEIPDGLISSTRMELIPAWRWIGEDLAQWDIAPPREETPEGAEGVYGFVQSLPEDAGLAVAARRDGGVISLATALGQSVEEDPLPTVKGLIETADPEAAKDAARAFWKETMTKVPRLDLPDETLTRQYLYGLARLVGCTMARCEDTPACGLQGPFMEDDNLPPWSNDYHMNVNVQMVYGPLLQTNLGGHFSPLWKMLRDWMPRMQRYGEAYFEKPGALVMPTAPDDRGAFLGMDHQKFGDGKPVNDHNCLAWIGRLAWLDYRYNDDEDLLKELVWPLLAGAFEGYWAMMERRRDADGKETFTMPYTMSPEYHKDGRNWGRDASFQLAACHSVVETLQKAAELIGEDIDERWAEVGRKLPRYQEIKTLPDLARSGPSMRAITAQSSDRRIGVWEDEDYSESHRHHSHLAAFYPFETIDPFDSDEAELAENSYNTWTLRGTGLWTGWSFPWASILCSRYNRPTAAVAMLHQLESGFTNEGGNTGHDGAPGVSLLKWRSAEIADRNWRGDAENDKRRSTEIIQMDAALGTVSAVLELLVQARPDGVVHVVPSLPAGWYELEFDGIGCPGGFRIGATARQRRTVEIRVEASRGGNLRLAHGMGDLVLINGQTLSGDVVDLNFDQSEIIILERVPSCQ